MTPSSFVILHGGTGFDPHLFEYLRRVVLTLTFVGGGAMLIHSGLEVASAVRDAISTRSPNE